MRIHTLIAAALLLPALSLKAAEPADIQRGRYLMTVAGCNDCHTDGYMQRDGQVPEGDRLLGSAVGFQGGWGTTYPTNLRLRAAQVDEAEWLKVARTPRLPPMPWFNLAAADDADLRAIYRYLRSLGPAGVPAPAYVAPGGVVTTPVVVFEPKMPDPAAATGVAATAR